MVDDGWRNETGIKRITKLYTLRSNEFPVQLMKSRHACLMMYTVTCHALLAITSTLVHEAYSWLSCKSIVGVV